MHLEFPKKINKFFRLSFRHKILLFEAFVTSGFFRLLIKTLPFEKVKKYLGFYKGESPSTGDTRYIQLIEDVSTSVKRVSKCTPWKSECLVQAMAVLYMLKRRGVFCTVYLGVNKVGGKKLYAHAWVKYENRVIIGGNIKKFTEVARFSFYKDK